MTVLGQRDWAPLFRPAPRDGDHGWLRFGDALGVALYVSEEVANDLVRWAEQAMPEEAMGLLAGRPCEDARAPYTLVTGAVRAQHAEHSRVHVFAGVAEVAELVADLRFGWPVAQMVGWWHVHPGYGTRYSRTDEETQEALCAPSSVGLVIDPTRTELERIGAYLGPRSGRLWPQVPPEPPAASALPPLLADLLNPLLGVHHA